MISRSLALLVVVLGCGTSAPSSVGDGLPTCKLAIDHSISLEKAELQQTTKGLTKESVAKVAEVANQHCTADAWSPVVMKCYVDSKTVAQLDACDALLTPDQQAKFHADVNAAVAAISSPDHGCTAALDNAMPLEIAEMKKQLPALPDGIAKVFKDASISHCRTDHWSAEVVACLAAARTTAELMPCAKLTPEQSAALDKDMQPIMQAAMAMGGGAVAHGGSATP